MIFMMVHTTPVRLERRFAGFDLVEGLCRDVFHGDWFLGLILISFRLELSSEFCLFSCFSFFLVDCALAVLTHAGELGKASFALPWGAFLLVHPRLVLLGSGIPNRCRHVGSAAQW